MNIRGTENQNFFGTCYFDISIRVRIQAITESQLQEALGGKRIARNYVKRHLASVPHTLGYVNDRHFTSNISLAF